LASLCFLLARFSLVAILGLVGWILIESGSLPSWAVPAVAVSIATLVISGINILANGRRVACPLCRASFFMSPRSLVKPKGPKLLGCAKTPLAFSLLTIPEVVSCPYCAERVRLTRSS
jgi:DNA-directed RNA polymerase subunit RPC12/RpoP